MDPNRFFLILEDRKLPPQSFFKKEALSPDEPHPDKIKGKKDEQG